MISALFSNGYAVLSTWPVASRNKWKSGCPESSQINNFASGGELVQTDVLEAGMHLIQWVAAEQLSV